MSADEDWAEERLRRHKRDGGEEQNNILKTKDGKSIFRLLPIPGKPQFFEEAIVHYLDSQIFRCLTTEWFGKNRDRPGMETECGFCKRWLKKLRFINKKYGRSSEASKKAWGAAKKELAPKPSFYSYAYDTKATEIEVKIFPYGPMIFGQLIENWVTGGIKFTKIKSGRNIIITKASKSSTDKTMVEYKVIISAKRADITEYWDQLKDSLPAFDTVIPKPLKPEKLEALLKASEVEFEEEEEEPRQKKKSRTDVESSSEEDDEEQDDEKLLDDDDEDEPKVVKKKSSPAVASAKKKLRAKAGEDEESDDEDADEEDSDDEEEEERPRSKKAGRIPF